ncbi:MAG TPA: EipA family protein, partial [Brevundimonas sp.]|nr:EipA family protein [Brevundimonas sp.]
GALHMKDLSASQEVFWQGISIGWDVGGNASRVFTLVYGLFHPDMLYRRYPGVEGSAYLVGGLGVNYQRADGIVLAPIRTGVGLRLGANVGTMAYSRQRNLLPF